MLQFNNPAGHIYMPVTLREHNYLACIYAFRNTRVKDTYTNATLSGPTLVGPM